MRCLGITKKIARCKNASKYPFCKQHKFQPIVLLFSLSSILAVYAGLWQDFIKPFFFRVYTPELDYTIKQDESNYLPGLLVDDIIWEEDFSAYYIRVENSSSSAEIYDLRLDLLLPGAVVSYKAATHQGCQDLTFSQYGASGGVLSNAKVRTTVEYYVNNLYINVARFFPSAHFTAKIILKLTTINKADSGLFRLQYRFKDSDENMKSILVQHPIVVADEKRKVFYIDKVNSPPNKLALQILPKRPLAFRDDGSIAYGVEGDVDESIRQFELAVQKNPESAPSYFNLGNVYLKRNRIDDAVAKYKLAIKYKPDYAEAYLELGYAYAMKGLTKDALSNFKLALRYNPNLAKAYNYIGITYAMKGQTEVAIENYQSAIELQSDYAEAHYNLALALFKKGLIDDSILHLELVRKHRPDVVDTYLDLGQAYIQKGMKNRATEMLKLFLKHAARDKKRTQQIREVERIIGNLEGENQSLLDKE